MRCSIVPCSLLLALVAGPTAIAAPPRAATTWSSAGRVVQVPIVSSQQARARAVNSALADLQGKGYSRIKITSCKVGKAYPLGFPWGSLPDGAPYSLPCGDVTISATAIDSSGKAAQVSLTGYVHLDRGKLGFAVFGDKRVPDRTLEEYREHCYTKCGVASGDQTAAGERDLFGKLQAALSIEGIRLERGWGREAYADPMTRRIVIGSGFADDELPSVVEHEATHVRLGPMQMMGRMAAGPLGEFFGEWQADAAACMRDPAGFFRVLSRTPGGGLGPVHCNPLRWLGVMWGGR